MEVSGSHGGAKQQQRVFVVVGSCRESLGAIGSHWESLGAVGVNFPTKVPGERQLGRRVRRRKDTFDERLELCLDLGEGSSRSQKNG